MQIGVDAARSLENKRVFVVDSDEVTRAALQFMLHDENETHEIPSLAEAYARAEKGTPDVILVGLPIVQELGIDVLGEIRERIPGAKLAVVVDSATDPTARRCLERGAHSLLSKPLTIESVRRKVDLLLGRRSPLSIPVQLA